MTEHTDKRPEVGLDAVLELARQHYDGAVSEEHHQQQKERMLGTVAAPKRKGGLGFALAAACLMVAALWWFGQQQPLTVVVSGRADATADVFAPLHAGTRPIALQFDDGSQVQFSPGASGRLKELGPNGAVLELSEGVALVRIVPRSKARWLLRAGPYSVLVTGTAFSLQWLPEGAALTVEMERGSVMVSGGAASSGILLKAGQRFVSVGESVRIERIAVAEGSHPVDVEAPVDADKAPAITAAATDPAPSAVPRPQQPLAQQPLAQQPLAQQPLAVRAPAAASAKPAHAPVEWSALVARGAFADVVQQAEKRGVGHVMQTAGAEDLGALADAARYLNRTELARQALTAQRSRFAGSGAARAAAFILGTMEDAAGHSEPALSFYLAYLAEGGGPLSRDALGRAILASKRAGQSPQAGTLATRYLAKYPAGPHASTARRIVEETSANARTRGRAPAPADGPPRE